MVMICMMFCTSYVVRGRCYRRKLSACVSSLTLPACTHNCAWAKHSHMSMWTCWLSDRLLTGVDHYTAQAGTQHRDQTCRTQHQNLKHAAKLDDWAEASLLAEVSLPRIHNLA